MTATGAIDVDGLNTITRDTSVERTAASSSPAQGMSAIDIPPTFFDGRRSWASIPTTLVVKRNPNVRSWTRCCGTPKWTIPGIPISSGWKVISPMRPAIRRVTST